MGYIANIGEVIETGRSKDRVSIEWRISNFLSLVMKYNEGFYESPSFNFCDGKWYMAIQPYGISQNWSTKYVSLCLITQLSGPPKTLHVTLSIRGAEGVENKDERTQEFSEKNNACFWNRFCLRSKLEKMSRLMPGNVLVVVLDINGVEPSIVIGVEELQKSLHGLLAGGKDSDVLIKVRGKEFPAHRAIMRARSTVFQAMFSHDMVEKQSGVVTMEDCDQESFPAFLEHVYTGSTKIISIGNVFSLFTIADKYDLTALKKACTEFIKNNLSVSCFCDAIALSVKHGEKELLECATEFFISNDIEILKTVDWEIFLKENTTVGNELLIKTISMYKNSSKFS